MVRNFLRGINGMSLEINGLTDFQRDLLNVAQKKLPKETKKIMRKAGSKAKTHISRKARAKVKKKTGNYHKKFKRGKVFDNKSGETVVRVINTSPHAHLIEHGHIQVLNPPKPVGKGVIPGKGIGEEVGFVRGKKVMDQGMQDFDNSGQYENLLSVWIDDLLKDGKL